MLHKYMGWGQPEGTVKKEQEHAGTRVPLCVHGTISGIAGKETPSLFITFVLFCFV